MQNIHTDLNRAQTLILLLAFALILCAALLLPVALASRTSLGPVAPPDVPATVQPGMDAHQAASL